MKKSIVFVAGLAISASLGAAEIGRVVVRQLWPWSTDVRIEYELSGVTGPVDVTVEAWNGSEKLDQSRLANALKGERYGISEGGVRTLLLDPVKAFGAAKAALPDFKVKLSVADSPANLDEVLYKIYDLNATSAAQSCTDVTRREILNGEYGDYVTDYASFGEGFVTSASDVLIWTGVTNGLTYKTDKLVMRRIKAGSFTCGGNVNTPGISITIDNDYFIGVFEATYTQCEKLTAGRATLYFSNTLCRAGRPMDSVTFDNIRGSSAETGLAWPNNPTATLGQNTYLQKIRKITGVNSFDLPQEIHWEYAARGGTQTIWNNGMTDEKSQAANTALPLIARTKYTGGWGWSTSVTAPSADVDTSRGTAEVGSYAPNAYGLYDCHGNVAEWCIDRGVPWANMTTDILLYGSTEAANSMRLQKGADWNSGVTAQKIDNRVSTIMYNAKKASGSADGTLGFRFYHAAE